MDLKTALKTNYYFFLASFLYIFDEFLKRQTPNEMWEPTLALSDAKLFPMSG